MQITTQTLRIRPLTDSDFALMLKWLTDEHILEYYGGRDLHYTAQTLREHYTEPFDGEGWRLIVEYMDIPIGYGQVYRVCDGLYSEYSYPDRSEVVYAMDQFIGETEYQNRGIGTEYVKLVCEYLHTEKQAAAVLLDPHKTNARAIRSYTKAGFKIIAKLPSHELFEGEMADCLLMEKRFDNR